MAAVFSPASPAIRSDRRGSDIQNGGDYLVPDQLLRYATIFLRDPFLPEFEQAGAIKS